MTQVQYMATILHILDGIITNLRYQEHSGTMLYRFEKGIELPNDIQFENHHYHWIDEIGINPQTHKLEYTISSRDSEQIRTIPVEALQPEILQIVHNRIALETQK